MKEIFKKKQKKILMKMLVYVFGYYGVKKNKVLIMTKLKDI